MQGVQSGFLYILPTVENKELLVEIKNAIVLATFGTAVESALPGLLLLRRMCEEAYPRTPIRLCFTSNIIRRIWRKRAADQTYAAAHPEVPADVLAVQGPLAAIANLQDAGYTALVVQPVMIAAGEEFADLRSYVAALNAIETVKPKWRPFHRLVIGRPALGAPGIRYPYQEDIKQAARALAGDVAEAAGEKAALVYMGHGNPSFPTAGYYLEMEACMQEMYPDVLTVIGTVEGFPSLADVVEILQRRKAGKVMVKPFMVVAGDHAGKDMLQGSESWCAVLEREGFQVMPVVRGLGEQREFAGLFVDHVADAAAEAGLVLEKNE